MRKNQDSERVTGEVLSVKVLKGTWGKVQIAGLDHPITADGVLGISVGDHIEARGRTTSDPKYGAQFRASLIRRTVPSDARGVVAWLAARLPAVGKKRAAELVERFGVPGIYETMLNDPQALCAIRGITPELAEKIRSEYLLVHGEQEEMTQLLGWGLTDGQIRRCREVFGADVIAVLRANPYRLCDEVHGFGWKRSDAIARAMGLPADHPTRVRACLLYLLGEAEGNGHCYVPRGALVRLAGEELIVEHVGLDVPANAIHRALDALVDEGKAVAEEARIYRPATHYAEAFVAERVRRMAA